MQRYKVECDDDMNPYHVKSSDGACVLYADAQAEIARLTPKPIKSLPGEFNVAEMFDAVEIDGEAYISLSQHVDALERALKVSTERDALKAERDQARAQIAAVIERAAGACVPKKVKMSWGNRWTPSTKNPQSAAAQAARKQCHDAILALTPDDATAALNQMLNEAYQSGQRDMRERADHLIECDGDALGGKSGAAKSIRALPIKERNE